MWFNFVVKFLLPIAILERNGFAYISQTEARIVLFQKPDYN
jgi:hypothetical protein